MHRRPHTPPQAHQRVDQQADQQAQEQAIRRTLRSRRAESRPRVGLAVLAGGVAIALSACGSGSDDDGPTRGGATGAPTAVASLTAAQITTQAGALASVVGAAKCDVSIASIGYQTVGGRGEATTGTAAVMVPTGQAAGCSGARPVVLYAHGTNFDKNMNMAAVATTAEGGLVLAAFAAQGYVVVAPNYTGYGASTLPYHPYLNAEAQSSDMVDALRATRSLMGQISTTTSLGRALFTSGYSQGGHVAMATQRALQQTYAGEFTVSGSAPMSGPYALATLMEQSWGGGQQIAGASLFLPMILDSYQASYGNLYTSTADVYQPPYQTIIPGLFPSTNQAAAIAQVPAGADSSYRTLFDQGDGSPFIIKSSYHSQTSTPGNPLYAAATRNDLTGWTPATPMQMCYGALDPTVPGANSTLAETAFKSRGATRVTRIDLEDATTTPTAVYQGFAATKAQVISANGGGAAGTAAMIGSYHGTLVPPFCMALARGYFDALVSAQAQ